MSDHKRPGPITGVIVLVCLTILIGLGVWQLQRLKWKEGVLAHIAALRTAPARPLGEVLRAGGDLDFTRVSFDCPELYGPSHISVDGGQRARVYSIDGQGQIVYRQMVACPAPVVDRTVMVDVGVEACAEKTPVPAYSGPLIGILRKPDAKTFVTPPNQTGTMLYFWRDLPAMAKAMNVDPPLPMYISLERGPQPTTGCKLARSPIPANIPNRHFEYALTWFGLAASLIGVYAAMLLRRRRN